ncbi:hypothetical protein PP707_07730 [Acetobacter pasteurianus]|nr:hypothetical protein [Acetobacter pasteurianus]
MGRGDKLRRQTAAPLLNAFFTAFVQITLHCFNKANESTPRHM